MLCQKERTLLRTLAKQVDEIGRLPIMDRRRNLWSAHNKLQPGLPQIVVFPEGSWRELIPEDSLESASAEGRAIERELRQRIFAHENIGDDSVIERSFTVHKIIDGLPGGTIDLSIDWGVPIAQEKSSTATGSYGFKPILNTVEDLQKLKVPVLHYEQSATLQRLSELQDLFGDILDVRLRGVDYVAFHIMYYYSHFRGLEQMMYDFYDEPELAHRLIAFFEEGYTSIVHQCEALGLFEVNNDGTYQSTGGFGYTDQLPLPDCDPLHVRPEDLWACAEAQELSSVSPAQTEEFCMSAERRLLARFGLNGYGCCEGLQDKLPYAKKINHLRRVSVSPFADIEKCAVSLGRDYIFSWKCAPFFLCSPDFEEAAINDYLDKYLPIVRDHHCVVEMILADTHTCHNQPQRFARWVALCRAALLRHYPAQS